jgi:hypothetical protein
MQQIDGVKTMQVNNIKSLFVGLLASASLLVPTVAIAQTVRSKII